MRIRFFLVLFLCVYLLGCTNPVPINPVPIKPVPSPSVINQLLIAHNQDRGDTAPSLQLNSLLVKAAQGHASWMDQKRRMSHTGVGGSSFVDRVRLTGYVMGFGGENIAAGFTTVPEVMRGWQNSPGHLANIRDPHYAEVGFGVSGTYWCTVFATPVPQGQVPVIRVVEPPPLMAPR